MTRPHKVSLRTKLQYIRVLLFIPMVILIFSFYLTITHFNTQYKSIIQNLNMAADLNFDFSTNIDAKMYRIVIGAASFEELNPQEDIDQAKSLVQELSARTNIEENKKIMEGVETLIVFLEQHVENIRTTYKDVNSYDENMQALDLDIYMLTSLIEETLSSYIRYEAQDLERLRTELEQQLNSLLVAIIILMLLILLIQWLLVDRLFRQMHVPIAELCEMTVEIGKGNFRALAPASSISEMQILSNSFSDMVRQIQSLIVDVRMEQSRLRTAELQLLQAQINPHFLYNTFGTIIRLIESNKQEDAVKTIISLSSFFRTMLSGGRDEISIGEEKAHITSYLEIQQTRYRDVLTYIIDIDPEIERYSIMKLTLQPLVENALYHGIKHKRGRGEIKIEGRDLGASVLLSVSDTGIGMKPEDLKKLQARIEGEREGSSFGLWNVQARIKLKFGASYKLQLQSTYEKGTTVSLELPKILPQEKNILLS